MILRVLKRAFIPIALAFLAWFAWQSRDLLLDVLETARPELLALAVIAWMVMHVLAPVFPMLVFRARKVSMTYGTAARIHIGNLPARYIPGGIWHTVGRIASFREMNIGNRDISIFVFLENTLAASLAFGIGGSLLAVTRGLDAWGQAAGIAAVAGALFLIASPFLLSLRFIGGDGRFPLRYFVALAAAAAVTWCVAATAFVVFVAAFPGLNLAAGPVETAGAYLFAWAVGFVSIFAPQGLGVFEVVAAELMSPAGTFMSVASLFAAFRLVILAADAVVWAILRTASGRRAQDLL